MAKRASRSRSKIKKNIKNGFFGLLFSILAFFFGNFLFKNDFLEVYFLDVGQGDSEYIKMPNNKKMLIDGGNSGKGERVVKPFLYARGAFVLDCAVVSHYHDDHIMGICEILNYIKIKNILLPKNRNKEQTQDILFNSIKTEDQIKYLSKGDEINLDETVNFRILYAGELSNGNENNNSIVCKLTYKEKSFLFTGDIEQNVEDILILRNDLVSTVLKSPHHGSSTSNTLKFLKKVNPDFAVFEVGENNKYHHPHPSILRRYAELKVKKLLTSENGTIKFSINKNGDLKVSTSRGKE